MKPELGQVVYCIYHNVGIMVDKVAYVGIDSFIVESFSEATEEDSWVWEYNNYNNKWFTDLSKAKDKLLSIRRERDDYESTIVRVTDRWYGLEIQEEA